MNQANIFIASSTEGHRITDALCRGLDRELDAAAQSAEPMNAGSVKFGDVNEAELHRRAIRAIDLRHAGADLRIEPIDEFRTRELARVVRQTLRAW